MTHDTTQDHDNAPSPVEVRFGFHLRRVLRTTRPPAETPEDEAERHAAITEMFQTLAPADAIQAAHASHLIALDFMADGALRAVNDPDAPPEQLLKRRAGALAASRALQQWHAKYLKMKEAAEEANDDVSPPHPESRQDRRANRANRRARRTGDRGPHPFSPEFMDPPPSPGGGRIPAPDMDAWMAQARERMHSLAAALSVGASEEEMAQILAATDEGSLGN